MNKIQFKGFDNVGDTHQNIRFGELDHIADSFAYFLHNSINNGWIQTVENKHLSDKGKDWSKVAETIKFEEI